MPARYEKINDLFWADDGDFVLEEQIRVGELGIPTGGDFMDTRKSHMRGWLQRVKTRLESATLDWQYLRIGANLQTYLAAENTVETANSLRQRLYNELSIDGLVLQSEMQIEVVPITESFLGVILAVTPPGTKDQVVLTHGVGLRDTNQQIMREA